MTAESIQPQRHCNLIQPSRQRVFVSLVCLCGSFFLNAHEASSYSIEPYRPQARNSDSQGPWRSLTSVAASNDSHEASTDVMTTSMDTSKRRIHGVTLKVAVDANGAAGEAYQLPETAAAPSSLPPSVRFTSPSSLDMVHRLRRDSDAVLIGRGTVVADDPSLTVRRQVTCAQQPLRVVLDPSRSLLSTETSLQQYTLFRDGLRTVLYHSVKKELEFPLPEEVDCVYLEPLADGVSNARQIDLSRVLDDLETRYGVRHVMVEGGPATAKRFLECQLVDRALIVRAPGVRFPNPATAIDGGMNMIALQKAGLQCLGSVSSEGDVIECWSRPGLSWPEQQLDQWP